MALGDITLPTSHVPLRDAFLRDWRLAAIDSGASDDPPVTPGTDAYLLAEATARLALVSLANVAVSDADRSVLTATGEALEEERKARGVPEVAPAGSTGKIKPTIDGSTLITSGAEFTFPNGLRGRVVGTYSNPVNGTEIDVEAVSTGSATNLAGGERVRFSNPPINVQVEAVVSEGAPLTGGTDAETDERKRERILQYMRDRPAGGNWADIRAKALASLGSLVDCYVYPALGGPSSCKVVPIKDFDVANNDYSRAVSSAGLQTVRAALFSAFSLDDQIVVQAVADTQADFALQITIPDSSLSGGNGQGWLDLAPWPVLTAPDNGRIMISAVANAETTITVGGDANDEPVDGQTHIAWWSSADRKFYTALIVSHSGVPAAWVLNLDRPLRGKNGAAPAIGDYVCPPAKNLDGYGETWINVFRALGPGENTTDANRLPRAKRRPFVSVEDDASITTGALVRMVNEHPEITALAFSSAVVTTPTVPGSVDTAPNVLVPRKFAVYKT